MKALFLSRLLEGTSAFLTCQGEQQKPFLIQWTTDNPREPGTLSPACRRVQRCLNLGPDAALWTRSPRPPSILSQTLFHNSHPSNIQQREYQHNQSYVCSFLSPPQPQCPFCPCNSPLSLLFLVKKKTNKYQYDCNKLLTGNSSVLQPAGCRELVTLCWAQWTARGLIYLCGLICGGSTAGWRVTANISTQPWAVMPPPCAGCIS